jgi:2,5-diamino-6-(ribosylamino)-4(3H)-pyrimidinone 5'-phosphate reductase
MLESVDGKINSGNTDALDVDRDWKTIDGLREGLQQYYDIESTTDVFSFNTGRVMAKIGINERTDEPEKMDVVTFVLLDNAGHLNARGIDYLSRWTGRTVIVTTNSAHPVFDVMDKYSNIEVMKYDELDLAQMLVDLRAKYGAEALTIQSGGNMNCAFLRADLIDYVNVVVAPVLVGGRDTATLIDGDAISSPEELDKIRPMKLIECRALNDSYVQLRYEVIHRKIEG